MSTTDFPFAPDHLTALLPHAKLEILLPQSLSFSPASLFRNDFPGRLSSVPQREHLFPDENTNVTLVLRTSASSEAVERLLPTLELILAVHATDAVPQGTGSAASTSGQHDLSSRVTCADADAQITQIGEQVLVIWKTQIHVPRPTVRLQRPAVYFTAVLRMPPRSKPLAHVERDDTLPSFEPVPANVLEALQSDPTLGRARIQLSEDRITKVTPSATLLDNEVKPIRGATKRALPVLPVLLIRLRYFTPADVLIASLHLQTSQLARGVVSIKEVTLYAQNATAKPLNPTLASRDTHAGDEHVLLYTITSDSEKLPASRSRVSVHIAASVTTETDLCVDLDINWITHVDLPRAVARPAFAWSRSLNNAPPTPSTRQALRTVERPPSVGKASTLSTKGQDGVVFNFTAPLKVVKGTDFRLEVQCLNRSSWSRRFALAILPPEQYMKLDAPQDDTIDLPFFVAPPMQALKTTDVLDLNTKVDIGPLPAGHSFETDMRFRAIRSGVLDLGALRIVDCDTWQAVDVRELPGVLAHSG